MGMENSAGEAPANTSTESESTSSDDGFYSLSDLSPESLMAEMPGGGDDDGQSDHSDSPMDVPDDISVEGQSERSDSDTALADAPAADAPAESAPKNDTVVVELRGMVSQLMEQNKLLMSQIGQAPKPAPEVVPEPTSKPWETSSNEMALNHARHELGDVSDYTLRQYAEAVSEYHRWEPYLNDPTHKAAAEGEIAKVKGKLQRIHREAHRERELAELRAELDAVKNGPQREKAVAANREKLGTIITPDVLASDNVGYAAVAQAMKSGHVTLDEILDGISLDDAFDSDGAMTQATMASLDARLRPLNKILVKTLTANPSKPAAPNDSQVSNPAALLPPPNTQASAVAKPEFQTLTEMESEFKAHFAQSAR